ncbi:zinc finger, CCHC-type containing protein [Tanacetum coccineum]
MSLGKTLPPWHQFLDQKIRGAHFSLGIVAGERFAIELTPSTFPQRHFAGDMFPQRHVAGEKVGMLLGKASNVIEKCDFRTLLTPTGNGADADISLESVRAVSERFANTVYSFFLGKRVASKDGMDSMLENGPWFTRNTSFILNKWNPDVNLLKEDVGNVSIWVKFHAVPMTAISKCRLSVIATKLDTFLMLEFYTSDMCMQSLGRPSYAKAMIELRADVKLKDTIMCPKKIVSDVVKNLKNPRQVVRGVQVAPNVGLSQLNKFIDLSLIRIVPAQVILYKADSGRRVR